jgi:excisionase family DNA binding protein
MDAILTTSQTAKLLGISVRTAQQWIETGVIPSWKTPGGHRRVYRADVLSLKNQGKQAENRESALVAVIAEPKLLAGYNDRLGQSGDWMLECYAEPEAALIAIGARAPAVVIVDLQREATSIAFRIVESALCGLTEVIVVVDEQPTVPTSHSRLHFVRRSEVETDLLPQVTRALTDSAEDAELLVSTDLFPVMPSEARRLEAVRRSGLLDTEPEPFFDQLTGLASRQFETPICLITVIASDRQWFKSRVGVDLTETERFRAFCNHTILGKGPFVVTDLSKDPRFQHLPDVCNPPHYRFYAGSPIFDRQGFALGSLCLMDYRPRSFSMDDREKLVLLSGLASEFMKLRGASWFNPER